MEVSFAKGVGVPCDDDQGNTSPSYSEDDDGDGNGDGEWIPPGLIGHHYEFDVTKANDTDLATLEWTIARLTTLISRWGGNVNVKRYC